MKNLSFSILFTFGTLLTSAQPDSERIKSAVEKLSSCGNFIRADQNYVYTGFGAYHTGSTSDRKAQPAEVRMIDIQTQHEYQVATLDSVVDILTHNDSTYVLTFSALEEWDMHTRQRKAVYSTLSLDQRLGDEQHARGMALYKNKLVIAHGRLGISFFDLSTKKASPPLELISQGPLESMAQDVTVSGNYAFVALDNYSVTGLHQKQAFRGLAVVDIENERIVKLVDDLPPGLDSISSDHQSLIASFYGNPIWKFSIHSILTSNKTPTPTKRVFKFPKAGHPNGKAFMDDKYYYSCFWELPTSGSYYKRGQIVLNRSQMMLD
ncbi:MAG: hypothetical protein JNL11_01400 [Bdellovibrionaceae bacterium]|nr:hypothetical protein [Pseudobdellovibrionaceae bacterium]